MQLKHLYQDFATLPEMEQRITVAKYRQRRDEEFTADREAYLSKKTKAPGKRAPAIKLSDEEKILMKKLGLKPAQIRALKAME